MTTALMVKCPECDATFRHQDFAEEGCGATCGCKNLEIKTKANMNSQYKLQVAVYYIRARPIIYESNIETGLTASL
jgi:hypothetical protein